MNKKMFIIGLGTVLIIVAAIAAISGQRRNYSPGPLDDITTDSANDFATPGMTDDGTEEGINAAAGSGPVYTNYTSGILEAPSENRRVLYFYANWCPTCRPADEDLRANVSKFPNDLTVIRVNYNDPETDEEEKALAQKYGVTYQHTFVQIDANGAEVTKWNGGKTEQLLESIRAL